jgi:hypothetical protein
MGLLENGSLESISGEGAEAAKLRGRGQRPAVERMRVSPSRQEILRDFEKLIEEKRLFGAAHDPSIIDGAEFDPAVLKKKRKGSRFLVRRVPSRAKLLRRWTRIFQDAISPCDLIEALSARVHELEHRNVLLLFGADRIIYDADIFHGKESVGEVTLSFASLRDPAPGLIAYFTGGRLRVVRIEHIRLNEQKSGYASTLFRRYERLFGDLGFDQFRVSAALSVGRYYWAKEGFDFSRVSEIDRRKRELRAFVERRRVPVADGEIDRLGHASDFARFRRDTRVPVYRDAEGYYSFEPDECFREEILLPLGKAFLLCSAPWEGYKTISSPGTTARPST